MQEKKQPTTQTPTTETLNLAEEFNLWRSKEFKPYNPASDMQKLLSWLSDGRVGGQVNNYQIFMALITVLEKEPYEYRMSEPDEKDFIDALHLYQDNKKTHEHSKKNWAQMRDENEARGMELAKQYPELLQKSKEELDEDFKDWSTNYSEPSMLNNNRHFPTWQKKRLGYENIKIIKSTECLIEAYQEWKIKFVAKPATLSENEYFTLWLKLLGTKHIKDYKGVCELIEGLNAKALGRIEKMSEKLYQDWYREHPSLYSRCVNERTEPLIEEPIKSSDETSVKAAPKNNIVFLDLDGVLLFPSYSNYAEVYIKNFTFVKSKLGEEANGLSEGNIGATLSFSQEAVANLKTLCQKTNAKIVISSNWRLNLGIDKIRSLFKLWDLDSLLIGETTHLFDRAKEIQLWLDEANARNEVDHFVILDDIDDGLSKQFSSNFVNTEDTKLFTKTHLNQALEILAEEYFAELIPEFSRMGL